MENLRQQEQKLIAAKIVREIKDSVNKGGQFTHDDVLDYVRSSCRSEGQNHQAIWELISKDFGFIIKRIVEVLSPRNRMINLAEGHGFSGTVIHGRFYVLEEDQEQSKLHNAFIKKQTYIKSPKELESWLGY